MNKQQRDYAVGRAATIATNKITAFTNKVQMSSDEKLEMIRAGKATLREDIQPRTSLISAYNYPGNEGRIEKIDAYTKHIKDELARIKDEIYLGDCDTALEILRGFEEETDES